MSAPDEPSRLLLLAAKPEWAIALRACIAGLGDSVLLSAVPSWNDVSRLYTVGSTAILFTTPDLQPAAGSCPLAVVLLLDEEPLQAPEGASDWLVLDGLTFC